MQIDLLGSALVLWPHMKNVTIIMFDIQVGEIEYDDFIQPVSKKLKRLTYDWFPR